MARDSDVSPISIKELQVIAARVNKLRESIDSAVHFAEDNKQETIYLYRIPSLNTGVKKLRSFCESLADWRFDAAKGNWYNEATTKTPAKATGSVIDPSEIDTGGDAYARDAIKKKTKKRKAAKKKPVQRKKKSG
jgi:hypothetical protein